MLNKLLLIILLAINVQILLSQNCTVNANVDQTVCSSSTLTLRGNDGGLFSIPKVIQWTQVSGPAANILNPESLQTTVTGLIPGNSYIFRLSTTCLDGSLVYDDVTVNVLTVTTANAGADLAPICPGNPAGILSANAPGVGETGRWSIVSGGTGLTINDVTSPTATLTLVSGSSEDAVLRWTITNTASGCTSYDDVNVPKMAPASPVTAGVDQTLSSCYNTTTSTTLAASYAGNGTGGQIGEWSVISGPNNPVFSNKNANNSTISNLIPGIYVLRWTVSGSCVSGSDDVQITVNTPVGSVTAATVSGYSFSNNTVTFCDTRSEILLIGNMPKVGETVLWTQASGPSATIVSPNDRITTITGLDGTSTYSFTYTITNTSTGCSSNRTVTVKYAGTQTLTITSPKPYILNCGASSAVISYSQTGTGTTQYSVVSGPTNSSFNYPTAYATAGSSTNASSSFTLNNLTVAGTYVVRVRKSAGTAANCDVTYDDISIIVSRPPTTSNAGTDQLLACNVTNTQLAGNIPTFGNGTWSQISGPNTATIANTSLSNTTISNLTNGNYLFRWLISNGPNCTVSQDDVLVRVALTTPTAANAGEDRTVCHMTPLTLNGNTPALNETGTWTVTPSAGIVFNNIHSPNAIVTGLIASTVYTFTWTISNACGTTNDNVVITTNDLVGPIPANAGTDQCYPSGTTIITMEGNNPSPGVGKWTKISGGYATITDETAYNTTVTDLTDGTYIFEWSIARNECVVTRDTVMVTISAATSTANAGADQTICGNTTTLSGNIPSVGQGYWSLISGNAGAVISDIYSNTPTVSNLLPGVYTFRWTITNNACSSNSDDVIINVSAPPATANAGTDKIVCRATSVAMNATPIPANGGTGLWAIIDGPGQSTPPVFSNVSSPTTNVTGLNTGTYIFRWSITNGAFCPPSYDDVIVEVVPNANAGADQNVCNVTSINLSGNVGTTGTWTQKSGNPATITPVNSFSAIASDLLPGSYTFTYTINTPGCSSSDDVNVVISAPGSPIDAGTDKDLCNVTGWTMNATPPTTYTARRWYLVSGPNTPTISSNTNPTATITGAIPGTYVYEWRVTNGNCSISDYVTIRISTVAAAGADQTVCGNTVTLSGNAPTNGTGEWTQIEGPNSANIVSVSSPQTLVTNLIPGLYTFRWTLSDGTCTYGYDEVNVTVNENPSVPDAGVDQFHCAATEITLNGNIINSGTGTWTKIDGPDCVIIDEHNPTTTVTDLNPGLYTFRWTSSNSNCVLYDDVIIVNYETPTIANAGPDKEICLYTPVQMQANDPVVGNGTWQQVSGSPVIFSDYTSATTSITGLNVGTYVFRWTISNGLCASSSDDVTITVYDLPTMAVAGADQTICGTSAILNGNNISVGTGSWSKISGPTGDIITNPSSPTTTITNLSRGTYVYSWKATNGICESEDLITVTKGCNPIALNDVNTTFVNIPVQGRILTNDFSPEGNQLNVNTSPVTLPTNGQVIINSDGTYTYFPNNGFVGKDNFRYSVCDNGTPSLCTEASVVIQVLPKSTNLNNPPVAVNDAYKGSKNIKVTGNVISNDFDIDGNLKMNSISLNGSAPGNGTLSLSSNGNFTFTPSNNFTGQVTFNYNVCDNGTPSLCDVGTVTIDILPEESRNSTYSVDDSYYSASRIPISGNIKTNDYDPQGHTQTFNTIPVKAPKYGNVVINSNGTFTYTPTSNYFTTDNFVYELCDNGTPVACDSATVYINYLPQSNEACAWRSVKNGDWSDNTVWEALNCNTGLWESTPVSPNNDRPVYVFDSVQIKVGESIVTDSLILKSTPNKTGLLNTCGSQVIDNIIVYEIDSSGKAGKLNNCGGCSAGTVTMAANSKQIARRILDSKWNFISFPFDVSSSNIFFSGTTNQAQWGDLNQSGSNVDFFVAEYNGANRANDPSLVAPTNSKYFVNVNPHNFEAGKGYIITGGNLNVPKTIDFVSNTAVPINFCDKDQTVIAYDGVGTCNDGWNLVGIPYTADFNLKYATSLAPYYIYDNGSYITVASNSTYRFNPFSAFFLQVFGSSNQTLSFDDTGLTNFANGGGYAPAMRMNNVVIELYQNGNVDKTTIQLNEKATDNFDLNLDGIKMMRSNSLSPQIYTEIKDACGPIAVNVLPLETKIVDLKVKTSSAGLTKISLGSASILEDIKGVVLIDSETGIETNLHKGETYYWENSIVGVSDRFKILIATDKSTGIFNQKFDGISLNINDKKLRIIGLKENVNLNVYDVVGKTIYSSMKYNSSETINLPFDGVYLIDINYNDQKVILKALINN